MDANTLRHWITGAAYDYSDGEVWPEWKHHSLSMWIWRLALITKIRSRIRCRMRGHVWPRLAPTMIGEARAQNIVEMVHFINRNNIPGALVDCGVWRGGSTILMAQAYRDTVTPSTYNRSIYCCDTFDGFLPTQAKAEKVSCPKALKVPVGDVIGNFRKYGVNTNNVEFLKGDVCETLRAIQCSVALLRVDVDMHKPTLACLEILYPKMPTGAVVIVDDYGCSSFDCRFAVDTFRNEHSISAPLNRIDDDGVYWIKE